MVALHNGVMTRVNLVSFFNGVPFERLNCWIEYNSYNCIVFFFSSLHNYFSLLFFALIELPQSYRIFSRPPFVIRGFFRCEFSIDIQFLSVCICFPFILIPFRKSQRNINKFFDISRKLWKILLRQNLFHRAREKKMSSPMTYRWHFLTVTISHIW